MSCRQSCLLLGGTRLRRNATHVVRAAGKEEAGVQELHEGGEALPTVPGAHPRLAWWPT